MLVSQRATLALDGAAVRDLLLRAMGLLAVDHEVSVLAVDAAEMAELNHSYRGKTGPTDVLSFALNEGEGGEAQEYWLGDIVVCPAVAARQAAEAGHSAERETCWLLVHGLLHLLGYDHERGAAEARIMRDKEQWLLSNLLNEAS
ncbi:MAG: rRNA maturation RNase YbeY [Nitrospirota bacterium]